MPERDPAERGKGHVEVETPLASPFARERRVLSRVNFRFENLFEGDSPAQMAAGERALKGLLAALVIANIEYLKLHPRTPLLYQSGVRYQAEPLGSEEWQDIPTILKRGVGDCEDLASWLTAEYRIRRAIRAKIHVSHRRVGGMLRYHIMVRLPDGRIEDPSARLGMR